MSTIIGGPQAETLAGTDDTDLILGRGGGDLIIGFAGVDLLLGGTGDDTIWGENAIGFPPAPPGSGPQVFVPTLDDNLILAGAGNDLVRAGLGSDTVFGGAGDDTLNGALGSSLFSQGQSNAFNTQDGPDWLEGGRGNDLIDGGSGDDTILGGAGDDTLRGTLGADRLTGGPGDDRFVFQRINTTAVDTGIGPGARDVITDFHHGQDRIDLSAYASPFFAGALPAEFHGTDPFAASFALQVRYDFVGHNTVVQFFSVLGATGTPTVPAGPTGEIELLGHHHLKEADFILA
jgi:Ca2+-binding RTX toxin-like protein